MNIIWAIIAGLVIGLLAKLVIRGRQPIPLWLTIIIGIIGAIVGNYIASAIHVRHTSGIDWIRHILQVAAAAVLISLISPMWMSRHSSRRARI